MPIDYTKPRKEPAQPPQGPPPQQPAAPPAYGPPQQPPAPPNYGPPQGYPQQPPAPPAYGPPQGYPQQPPAPPAYGPPQGYPQQPPAPPGYGPPPAAPGYGPPPAGAPGVSLNKVTLSKAAPTVSLSKQGGATGILRVNLNWASGGGKRGLFGKSKGVDLDIACLYEFTNGDKGVVQALGNAMSTENDGGAPEPIIYIDKDDRSGMAVGGENMYVNLKYLHLIRRVLIFTFIYEGVPNWAQAKGVVTLYPVSGPEIEVWLDEGDPRARSCAIALLENINGELMVKREVRYIDGGQRLVDQAYGFGLNWTPGRK